MGFFDSSSSSSTSNVYNTDNTNTAAQSSGIALRNSTLISIDPGAFELAGKSIDTVGSTLIATTGKALDYGAASQESAFDFLKSAFTSSLAFTGDTVSKNAESTTKALQQYQSQADASLKSFVELSTSQNKQSVQALTENVFKYGAWALVGLALSGAAYAYAQRTKH